MAQRHFYSRMARGPLIHHSNVERGRAVATQGHRPLHITDLSPLIEDEQVGRQETAHYARRRFPAQQATPRAFATMRL